MNEELVKKDADPAAPEPTTGAEEAGAIIDLPSGGDLTPETAGCVTRAFLTRLVLLAGEAESGKTTLLATIYEKFNEGPFANLLFAGSETLIGWEKRCYLARVVSGAEKADTERTLGLQQRLLHLSLRDEGLENSSQHLLFTDFSGEVFKLIRDSTAECQRLGILKRTDHFVLLLDGSKVADTRSRHEALNNGMALLRSCIDAGMVGLRSFVDVVFSKYDLVAAAGQPGLDFQAYAVTTITRRFSQRLGRLRFHNVAARPEAHGMEFAYGVAELLRSWVNDSPYFVSQLAFPAQLDPSTSQFQSYLRVRFPDFCQIGVWI